MPVYEVIYGGRKPIDAQSEAEAYQQFWEWADNAMQQGIVGRITGATVDSVVDSARDSVWTSVVDSVRDAVWTSVGNVSAGGTVVCAACSRDYSTSAEPGGVLIGRTGYGPCCAEERILQANTRYFWSPSSHTITRCPPEISFRDWMLSQRSGDHDA